MTTTATSNPRPEVSNDQTSGSRGLTEGGVLPNYIEGRFTLSTKQQENGVWRAICIGGAGEVVLYGEARHMDKAVAQRLAVQAWGNHAVRDLLDIEEASDE